MPLPGQMCVHLVAIEVTFAPTLAPASCSWARAVGTAAIRMCRCNLQATTLYSMLLYLHTVCCLQSQQVVYIFAEVRSR